MNSPDGNELKWNSNNYRFSNLFFVVYGIFLWYMELWFSINLYVLNSLSSMCLLEPSVNPF